MPVDAKELMNWQEKMSNTAHVREVKDLQAAGLNPVLSAKLGGASTPSGAMDPQSSSGGGGGGYRRQVADGDNSIPNDGSVFGNLISNLNPNGTTRIGKVSIPNWVVQGAYQLIFGDGGTVTPGDVAEAVNDQTGASITGQQLVSAVSDEDHLGMDDEGWNSRGLYGRGDGSLAYWAKNLYYSAKAASQRRQARGRNLDQRMADIFS